MSFFISQNLDLLRNPETTSQKIKKFHIVLCSLKLFVIFQLDIQDICQIQHNFNTSQETHKFIKNMRLKLFPNSPSFKKIQGFKTKVCVILDCLSFCDMFISQKLKFIAKKSIYIITGRMY